MSLKILTWSGHCRTLAEETALLLVFCKHFFSPLKSFLRCKSCVVHVFNHQGGAKTVCGGPGGGRLPSSSEAFRHAETKTSGAALTQSSNST